MVNVWSRTKKSFCFKNPFFAKNAIFSKIMPQSKYLFWLIQAPYISKHISRNGGATIKASWKTAHDKVFFLFWGKKAIFPQKMAAPSKKSYSRKYVYWYQCFNVWKMVGTKSLVHGRPTGLTLLPFHSLTLLVHVSQWIIKVQNMWQTCTLKEHKHVIVLFA